MVTVLVVWQSTGKPAKDQKVVITFDGFWTGGVTGKKFTDDKGEVHYDEGPGDGEVYVNGKSIYKGRIEGRVVVYI